MYAELVLYRCGMTKQEAILTAWTGQKVFADGATAFDPETSQTIDTATSP